MNICFIVGTRPEIIKLAPVMQACQRARVGTFLIHTGQHYDYEMDRVFFKEFGIARRGANLKVGSGTHAEVTARALVGIERVLLKRKPDIVLVEGDTNTVLAGALAAVKIHAPLGHVEAGLRSRDRSMPEEHNRVVADHLSDLLFAPTRDAKAQLAREGIISGVHVTGNTIVDAVRQNAARARLDSNILQQLGLAPGCYFLATAHRQENVDSEARLDGIVHGLHDLTRQYGLPVVFPVHPRTRRRIEHAGLVRPHRELRFIDPLGYFDFLALESQARLILTDSGGVQEESCILKVPCVTLRDNTERPETLRVGANVLAGCDAKAIVRLAAKMLGKKRQWRNPFGDGKSAERIVRACRRFVDEKRR